MRTVTALLLIFPAALAQSSYVAGTVAGSLPLGNGGPALSALLEFPIAVTVDPSGNIYFSDSRSRSIRVVTPAGIVNAVTDTYAADVKSDNAGNIYYTDGFFRVFKINRAGVAGIFAGGSHGAPNGDNIAALSAAFNNPQGIATDSAGTVYVADTFNFRVCKITADGVLHTIAGTGVQGTTGDGGAATAAQLDQPAAMAVDSKGNVYVAQPNRVRKISASGGIITTVAGGGRSLADGPALQTQLGVTLGLAVDGSDNLLVADGSSDRLRILYTSGTASDLPGTMRTIAGISESKGFSGDNGPATAAQLSFPVDVAVDFSGNVYIADDDNQRIRKVNTAGIITTVAGRTHFGGDNGPATAAVLHLPEHAVMDAGGNLYISDSDNNRIRKVNAAGVITTLAGNGACTLSGDGGTAVGASLCNPAALAFDAAGNLYVADFGNCRVRRVDTRGLISTVAGSTCGDSGDNGPATAAQFKGPFGIALDADGSLYISDQPANRVRKVAPNGVVTAFAGTGAAGSGGDGGLAVAAQFNAPGHLAVGAGAVYIADTLNHRIRKVLAQIVTNFAGTQVCCGSAADAVTTYLGEIDGIAFDAAGNLYVSQPQLQYVSEIAPSGAIAIVAGNNIAGFGGDGALALQATFSVPAGLWANAAGDVWVADQFNSRIRKLTLDSPSALAIAGGDGQTGPVNATLPGALSVAISFRAGVPAAGVPVAFAVTAGSATLSAGTVKSDGGGAASITVTLGSQPGPVAVTATVAGVAPVTFHLTAAGDSTAPSISVGGVVGAGGSVPPVTAISTGGLVSIYGSNFAPAGTARAVQVADLVNGALPTNLAGTCVQVNGAFAPLLFVSPGLVNVQAPAVPVNSSATVSVIVNCGQSGAATSAALSVATQAAAPEFLYWSLSASGKNPVVAVNSLTGAGAGGTFAAAKPGDYLTIYGISFGPTNPPVAPGIAPVGAAPTVNAPAVTFGGVPLDAASVLYAGVSPGTAGLYQLNIQVPAGLPDGDYAVTLKVGNFVTPGGGYISVRN